jgi:hypothetical protein
VCARCQVSRCTGAGAKYGDVLRPAKQERRLVALIQKTFAPFDIRPHGINRRREDSRIRARRCSAAPRPAWVSQPAIRKPRE